MPLNGPDVLAPAARPADQKFWDPELQTMDRERLRQLQDERVRAMVAKVFDNPVPLFRRKLESAGIDKPAAIGGVDDLSAIPLTVKQDLRDSEAEHPPVGDYRFTALSDCVRYGQSTGTTGTPTSMLWTRHDIWVEYESAARNWWRMGYRPGMSATHAHPAYLYGGGLMLTGTYEYFGLLNIWVPPPDTDELAELGINTWLRMKPDIPFVGFSLGRYFEVIGKMGLDPFTDVGLKIPNMGGGGRGAPLMTAGLECYAYLGGTCGQSPGAHIHEDWCVVQAVDPATGREVPDGEWGNLTVTTIDRDNGLLRYDLEEACALDRAPCPCGETSIRGFWGGRFKDLLACQGTRFQVTEVEKAIREAVPELARPSLEYVVVKPASEDAVLCVRVEHGEGAATDADLGERCVAAVKDRLGVVATIDLLERNTLPRSGYKTNRVVDA